MQPKQERLAAKVGPAVWVSGRLYNCRVSGFESELPVSPFESQPLDPLCHRADWLEIPASRGNRRGPSDAQPPNGSMLKSGSRLGRGAAFSRTVWPCVMSWMDDWQQAVLCRYIWCISCPSQGPSAALRALSNLVPVYILGQQGSHTEAANKGPERTTCYSFFWGSVPHFPCHIFHCWFCETLTDFASLMLFLVANCEKWVKEARFIPVCTVAYRLNSLPGKMAEGSLAGFRRH